MLGKRANRRVDFGTAELTGLAGGFDRSMQHHLMNVSFKDGVYDPRKMVETFA